VERAWGWGGSGQVLDLVEDVLDEGALGHLGEDGLAVVRDLALPLGVLAVQLVLVAAPLRLGRALPGGRHPEGVGVDGLAAEAAGEHANGRQHKPRPDLQQGPLDLLRGDLLVDDLVVAEPDAVVKPEEAEDVVHEGLAEGVVPRGPEDPVQERLHRVQPRVRVEHLIEVEEGAAPLDAVARQLELPHRVDVGHVEAHGGPKGDTGRPHVQVLALPVLEKDSGVAAAGEAELLDVVAEVLLLVQLVLLLAVGQQRPQILDEVALAGGDASRGEHQRADRVLGGHRGGRQDLKIVLDYSA